MRIDHGPLAVAALSILVPLAGCGPADSTRDDQQDTDDMAAESTTDYASWSYSGETGPANWGDLSPDYATCTTGDAQSPIDVPTGEASRADLPGLEFGYGSAELQMEDTGHSYQATPGGEHTLTIGSDEYRLVQFHEHTPSEHTVDGSSYPMELHFVHQNEAGELAVAGVMVEEGSRNEAYGPIVDAVEAGSATVALEDLASLLPSGSAYFTYPGSLTTPPCTEGVRWLLLEEPIAMSAGQLAVFREAHGETNRPVQPLNDREIRYSGE